MKRALTNLAAGIKMYPLWLRLAVTDIQQIYRRTLVGMAWITFSFALFIGVKILVFGAISFSEPELFAVWLTVGFWVWTFILGNVSDGCMSFITARPWILGMNLPLSVFSFQSLSKQIINFSFSAIVVAGVLIVMNWAYQPVWLWALPGILVLIMNGMWVHLLLATVGSKHRDIIHLSQSMMRVMFFVTPILYMPEQLGDKAYLLNYNPFTHYLAIVRDPIVMYAFPTLSWIVVGSITVIGWIVALIVFNVWGRRVPFWV